MVTRGWLVVRSVLAAAMVVAVVGAAPAAVASCADWNPLDNRIATAERAISADDLIRLTGFGRPDGEPEGDGSPVAISPDGRHAAIILERADLATNGFCQALVLIDLTGSTPPRILDQGGDFIMLGFVFRKIYVAAGVARLNAPAWSGDGQSITFLRRDRGSTQVWRVRLDGAAAMPVTRAPVDIEAWSWGADGRSLVYAVNLARAGADRVVDDEGLAGWHYDARFAPVYGMRPNPPAPQETTAVAIDPDSGRTSAPSAADRALLARDREDDFTDAVVDRSGDKAWIERSAPSPYAPLHLVAAGPDGARYACGDACEGGLMGMWWDADRQLTFIRREGWNRRNTAIYRWAPGRDQPRRLLVTDDNVDGCRPATDSLICVREGAAQPPRLVAIDRRTGREHILFDPNPGFDHLILGRATRLTWRNAIGREVYGDLVLPPGYRGGALPTIVVQYRSEGFLRGGTGNEYPIYLFAQHGFAVLSIQSPRQIGATDPAVRTEDDLARANTRNWAERRNALSGVEAGVKLLVDRGIADPKRVGITGLSDGASTVRFALGTTRTFAAAAISTCCVDETSDMLVGPAWAAFTNRTGYPPAYPVDSRFWQPYSLVQNAARMTTPLLMQLADHEALMGIPTVTALRAYAQPVDLYVFPDELHIKWQPRHRAALFARNLAWFSFWLQGREAPSLATAEEFARWRALRDARAQRMEAPWSPSAAGP